MNTQQFYSDSLIEYFIRSRRSCQPRTIENYVSVLDRFGGYLATSPTCTDMFEVADGFVNYLFDEGLAVATVTTYARTMSVYFEFLVERRKLTDNPFDVVRVPRRRKKFVDCYSFEEYLQLDKHLAAQGGWIALQNRLAIGLMFTSGIRINGVLGLLRQDIDIDQRTISFIDKGGDCDSTAFIDEMAPLFESYFQWMDKHGLGADAPLFIAANTRRQPKLDPIEVITDSGFRQRLKKKICKKSGVPYRCPHTFRHSCAAWMIREGAGIGDVKEQLRHKSIEITIKYYGHWVMADKRSKLQALATQAREVATC